MERIKRALNGQPESNSLDFSKITVWLDNPDGSLTCVETGEVLTAEQWEAVKKNEFVIEVS